MEILELKDLSIKSLKKHRDEMALAVSKLEDAIRILEGSQEKPIDWKYKAFKCLKKQNRFLRTAEMLECMFYNESDKIQDERKRRNYITALSLALNNLCDQGLVGRIALPGKKGFYYGFKSWYSEHGTIKQEYNAKLDEEMFS